MNVTRLALLPRDGVFCKDGRGWYTSEVGRSHSYGWPPPHTTVRGALRGAFGRQLEARQGKPLSPNDWEPRTAGVALTRLLSLRRPLGEPFQAKHRMWAAPADALVSGAELIALRPGRLPESAGTLGPEDDDAIESLWPLLPVDPREPDKKQKPASGFWTDAQMLAWLQGKAVTLEASAEPKRRLDYHLAIDPLRLVAEDSLLHASETTETLEREPGDAVAQEWALALECTLPEDVPAFPGGPLGLGGRRRLALVDEVGGELFAPPELPGARGLRLVLATPAQFTGGWLPDSFSPARASGRPAFVGRLPGLHADVILRAAAVPRPQHLASWDMVQRQPRKTRRLVPAGAVYFFQRADGQSFSPGDMRALWLAPLGSGREEALGLVLPGTWDPP